MAEEKRVGIPSNQQNPLPLGFTQVDTPNDDHCLLWSAALALLLSRLEDEDKEAAFTMMYLRLFGEGPLPLAKPDEKSNIITIEDPNTIAGVRNLLRTYDCQKNTPHEFEGDVLYTLVSQVFRGRVCFKSARFSWVIAQPGQAREDGVLESMSQALTVRGEHFRPVSSVMIFAASSGVIPLVTSIFRKIKRFFSASLWSVTGFVGILCGFLFLS